MVIGHSFAHNKVPLWGLYLGQSDGSRGGVGDGHPRCSGSKSCFSWKPEEELAGRSAGTLA